ncbi:MAG: MFS transporter [Methanobacteriota archaeon]|nr:MAG: MFS transporter [Euryarchaeota archaeon]
MGRRFLAGISVNVVLLGITSFLNDLSSEIITPILPMFITALGGSGVVIGFVGGLRDSVSNILKVLCGYWSDKKGERKIFVSSGYLTSSFFKLFLAFSKTWHHAAIFTGLERAGKGLRTAPRDAMIADSMVRDKGKGFGVHRALDASGAILGAITVFVLFWFFELSFRLIIFTAATISFLSLIPLSFVGEEKKKPGSITFKLGVKGFPGQLRLFILVSTMFSMANFSYMFFILKAQQLFTDKESVGIPILLYILFNFFYATLAIPFGALSDKIGRRKVILMGYTIFSVTCLGFSISESLIPRRNLFSLYGVVYAMVDGNQRAYVADLSPEKLKATSLGTFHTATGLATLPASLVAGYLWENVSPATTFIYGSVVSAVSIATFIALKKFFED